MLVGITGGIASGKSRVTRMLADRGAITFSADEAARAVLTPNGPALKEIAERFGPTVLGPDGQLDRVRLGALVFSDPQARDALNEIMHPRIRRLLHDQIESAIHELSPDSVIAVEIPLLYENNLQTWFERIVVVTASEATQIARLRKRNGLTDEDARLRLAAQMPLADKQARADYVVENDGSLDELARSVDQLWHDLTHRSSAQNAGVKDS